MYKKIYFSLIVGVLMALLIVACDSERFVSYKYEADRVNQQTEITGTISHFFTNGPVAGVVLDFEGQRTATNFAGQYRLNYIMDSDEGLDRPVNVRLRANNFFDLDTVFVVYPLDNTFNAKMVYGAPIIQNATFLDTIVNVEVFDYQGIGDIDSVIAETYYFNDSTDSIFAKFYQMELTQQVSENAGVYRTAVADSIGLFGLLKPRYNIIAVDKFGFKVTKYFFF